MQRLFLLAVTPVMYKAASTHSRKSGRNFVGTRMMIQTVWLGLGVRSGVQRSTAEGIWERTAPPSQKKWVFRFTCRVLV